MTRPLTPSDLAGLPARLRTAWEHMPPGRPVESGTLVSLLARAGKKTSLPSARQQLFALVNARAAVERRDGYVRVELTKPKETPMPKPTIAAVPTEPVDVDGQLAALRLALNALLDKAAEVEDRIVNLSDAIEAERAKNAKLRELASLIKEI